MRCLPRLLPAFSVLLLLATAATDAQEKQNDTTPNYYPLQVGNQWSFKVTVGENTTSAVARVVKMEMIDGMEMARLEAFVNGNLVATEHLRQTEQGIFRYRNNDKVISPPICLLKYPVAIKPKEPMKWGGEVKVDNDKGKYNCEAFEETIEIAGKSEKTIRVSIQLQGKGQNVNTSYWFVKDKGFIRQTVDAAGHSIVMELEKFERVAEKGK